MKWIKNIVKAIIDAKKAEQEPIVYYCDGCGKKYYYPLHDHYCYTSCSKECDDIINQNMPI